MSEEKKVDQEDLKKIIRTIKHKNEEDFQAYLKTLSPEEREKAIEFAKDML